jgi:hypothetical protein
LRHGASCFSILLSGDIGIGWPKAKPLVATAQKIRLP